YTMFSGGPVCSMYAAFILAPQGSRLSEWIRRPVYQLYGPRLKGFSRHGRPMGAIRNVGLSRVDVQVTKADCPIGGSRRSLGCRVYCRYWRLYGRWGVRLNFGPNCRGNRESETPRSTRLPVL